MTSDRKGKFLFHGDDMGVPRRLVSSFCHSNDSGGFVQKGSSHGKQNSRDLRIIGILSSYEDWQVLAFGSQEDRLID